MTVKLLTERYLEFLSLTEGCTGSSKSILVKTSHVVALIIITVVLFEKRIMSTHCSKSLVITNKSPLIVH